MFFPFLPRNRDRFSLGSLKPTQGLKSPQEFSPKKSWFCGDSFSVSSLTVADSARGFYGKEGIQGWTLTVFLRPKMIPFVDNQAVKSGDRVMFPNKRRVGEL